jgi:hypothetical protein
MRSGAAVVNYEGKRGTVWRVKFRDASGKQLMETLGRAPEWNRRKAETASAPPTAEARDAPE